MNNTARASIGTTSRRRRGAQSRQQLHGVVTAERVKVLRDVGRTQIFHALRQSEFAFPRVDQTSSLKKGEIIVDLFAGGGGASEALEQAIGQPVDVAVNHDEVAIGMHAANHPFALHIRDDVWNANPLYLTAGRLVGWLHGSPDCTHFSQAIGGQPRSRVTRALSWCIIKWVGMLAKAGLAPRIVSLENVPAITKWGRLIAKRCRLTGRVVKLDGNVAAPGERVPVQEQFLIPDKRYEGRTWRQFISRLRALGYAVEWRTLVASDFGAGTSRKRLFLIARRDGEPIRWPEPTHGPGRQHPYVSAAQCIDWNHPGRSVFNRKRPLARNTVARVLDGARRGNWPLPFVAALDALLHGRPPMLELTPDQARDIQSRLRGTRGEMDRSGDVAPLLMGTQGTALAKPVDLPLPTITTGGAGNQRRPGCARPQLIEPIIGPYYGSGSGKTATSVHEAPLPKVPTRSRFGLTVPVIVSTCNSSSRGVCLGDEPLRTITTARGGDFAVAEPVVVGYRIDILYRMLDASELFTAQGFPKNYIIDRTADGRGLAVHESIRMVGNSVSPPPLIALAKANLPPPQPLALAA